MGSSSLFAQDKSRDAKIKASEKEIKDKKGEILQDESGMLIKVMAVVLIVWIGIAAFMIKINIKIVKLEREINDL